MSVKFRLSRPFGITQAMVNYHQTKDESVKEKILSFMIQQWILSNGLLCGRSMNALQLSEFLKCDPERVRIQIRDQFINTRIWDKNRQEELLNSLIGQQVMWALEDRMEIEQQLSLLKRSQKGSYTPFVTSEVNKVLGLKLSSSQGLASVIRSVSGGGSINIFNNNQQQQIQGISMDKALDLIQQENAKIVEATKIEDEKAKDALYTQELKYIEGVHKDKLREMPVVVATEQRGVDTSKEAMAISQSELNQIADDYKGAIESFDKEHHEIRREIELGIDPDDPDPELDLPI